MKTSLSNYKDSRTGGRSAESLALRGHKLRFATLA